MCRCCFKSSHNVRKKKWQYSKRSLELDFASAAAHAKGAFSSQKSPPTNTIYPNFSYSYIYSLS